MATIRPLFLRWHHRASAYLAYLQEDELPLPPSEEHDRQPIREEVAVILKVA